MKKIAMFVQQVFRFVYLNLKIYGMTKHKH